ncbi:MAG: phosphorylase family protein, partial [Thermomicrobiales bacterium]
MIDHEQPAAGHEQSVIAIIVALEEEMAHLRVALPAGQDEQRVGRVFTRTELAGRAVVLARCGIGMISAAAVTEAVIILYAPAAIINYG